MNEYLREDLIGTAGLITHRVYDLGVMFGGATGLTVILLAAGAIPLPSSVMIPVAVVSCLCYLACVLLVSVIAVRKIDVINRDPGWDLVWACLKVGYNLAFKSLWLAPKLTVHVLTHAFENRAKPKMREFAATFADHFVSRQLLPV